MARVLPLTLVLGLCCFGAPAGAEAARQNAPAVLLQDMSKAFSEGDFEGSWRSLRRFFESAPPDEMERLMSAHCWGDQRATLVAVCPPVDFLAWLTGQTAADFGFVDRLCEVRRDEPDGFAWRAGWSCDRLALLLTKHRNVLSSSSPPLRSGRMGMSRPNQSEARRVAIAGWEHWTFWALLDTGAPITSVPRTALEWGGDRLERLGTSVAIAGFDGVAWNREQVLLRDFGGPGMAPGDLPATVAAPWMPDGLGIIGMNALIRFEAMCFSWRDEVLHLGELGPCGEGVQPHRAWLSGTATPMVAIERAGAPPIRVFIDTGAPSTHCAEGVARADDVVGELRFGDHPDMALSCGHEPPPESGSWLRHADVLAGMELLARFDAFGRRLNPFEMYFVPKRERDVAPVDSGA